MENIIYGIIGIVILLGSTFLFSYFDVLSNNIKPGVRKNNDFFAGKVLASKIQSAKLSGIPDNNERFASKKKRAALPFGIFSFLLFRSNKRKNKITHNAHI